MLAEGGGASVFVRKKKLFLLRRRAGIEPMFGYLKKEYRIQENFLSGKGSTIINVMLAATGWNLKKLMRGLGKEAGRLCLR